MGDRSRLVAARDEARRTQVTPEQWRQVKGILASALEQPPDARQAFLDRACAEPSLRRELQSLIAAHEQSGSGFINRPASTPKEILRTGVKIGSYEIVAPLGAGGMGIVYKARDLKLGRLLALKFLPEGALANEAARARLLREAQHASALNHPNIATVYDAGEEAGRVYISMELVEGQPLSLLVKPEGLATETVVRYGLQVSAALYHAHDRGVIHRDLKTANIVITADGNAKVLDFGLAKRLSTDELAEVTRSLGAVTEIGNVVGTPAYMAPETLRGEPADARTDIWALGAVLYEMATGTQSFQGRTPYELIQAILWEPPRPLPPRVPQGLRAIIQRCLSKERGQRYQRAAEVRAALEAIEQHSTPSPSIAWPHAPRKRIPIAIASGALVAVVLLVAVSYALFRTKAPAPTAVAQSAWVQLTDFADSAVSPALSPDGRMLAFIRGSSTFFGPGEISVMLLPGGEAVQLTHDGLAKMSPEFSPDGSTIAYTVPWDTWTVSALGSDPRPMLANAEGLTWIDPQHILFSEIKSGIHMALVTATQSRSNSRDVYVPPRERGMAHRSSLSPDRKWVLLSEMDNGGWLPCRVVPFDGSSSGKAIGPSGAGCTYVAWSPDEEWMYFNSDAGGRFHLWRQGFPDGEPQQLTSGATDEEGIAVAPDGKSLITSSGLRESTLWVRDSRGERQISSEGYASRPQFSRDGKKLYYVVRRHGVSGSFVFGELWVADLTANRSDRLLPGFLVTGYDVSPDGKSVIFSALDEQEHSHLWFAPIDLRFSPREFSSSVDEDEPYWDRAGHLYFRAAEGKSNFLYRMNADGSGRTKALPDAIIELEGISPDGKWALVGHSTGDAGNVGIAALPLGGGPAVTVCHYYCGPLWNTTGDTFSVTAIYEGGKTAQIHVSPGKYLPEFPPGGLASEAGLTDIKDAKILDGFVIAGPTRDLSAALHQTVHRNLYRIPLQ
jgi:Tol biopolymer transport system component/tRNA A-37 threonylcarbamoyl transferase component Bud32